MLKPPKTGARAEVAICMSVTSDLEFAAGVTIRNFVALHGSEGFEFYIFSDKKLHGLEKALSSINCSINTVEYDAPIEFVSLWSSRAIAYFSPLVLAKFEAFNLLEYHDSVVWLDYDIVILKPLTEVLDQEDFDFAFMKSGQPASNGFLITPTEFRGGEEGMSAGLLVVRRSFPDFSGAASRLYEIFLSQATNVVYPEQAVFDLFIRESSYKYLKLDGSIYSAYPGLEDERTAIIHSWGYPKFWNGLDNEKWNQYYKEWLSMGGSRYNHGAFVLRRALRGAKFFFARWMKAIRVVSARSRK